MIPQRPGGPCFPMGRLPPEGPKTEEARALEEPFWDAVVVGAGPAGAATARSLTLRGRTVLLLERHTLPRYKLCSGMIVPRGIRMVRKHWGEPPLSVFSAPERLLRMEIHGATGPSHLFPTQPSMWNVWRAPFDAFLVENSGARVVTGTQVVGFEHHEGGVRVRARAGSGSLTVRGAFLIGADGGRSTVRRLLDPVFERETAWWTATHEYWTSDLDLPKEAFHGFWDPSLTGFYTWLSRKDGVWALGTAVPRGQPAGEVLERFRERLVRAREGRFIDRMYRSACAGNDMAAQGRIHLGGGSVLLTGEAAGFLAAFAEGIGQALATGWEAGEAVADALEGGGDALARYALRVAPEIRFIGRTWRGVSHYAPLMGRGGGLPARPPLPLEGWTPQE